jgi:hypothetical protein
MSDWALEKARKIAWNDILGYSLETKHNAEVIATALREAEARGRASMKEKAAKWHEAQAAHDRQQVGFLGRCNPANVHDVHDVSATVIRTLS